MIVVLDVVCAFLLSRVSCHTIIMILKKVTVIVNFTYFFKLLVFNVLDCMSAVCGMAQ